MAIYIDFSFHIGATHLVAAGWGLRDTVGERFTVRDAGGRPVAGEPAALFTHVRPDIADDRAVGFVMIFRLDGGTDDAGEGEATYTVEGATASAVARHTGRALDDFVAFAGDEPFLTLLGEVAAGRLPPLSAEAAALVFERIRTRPRGMVETPRFAAAFDDAIVDREAGIGIAVGWILTASPDRAVSMQLLALSPSGILGADAAFDALPRSDLEGFRHRLSVAGRAGFVACVPVVAGARSPLLVLLLASGGHFAAVVHTPELAEFTAVARRFCEVAPALDPETRTALRAGLTRHLATPRLLEAAASQSSPASATQISPASAPGIPPAERAAATPVLLLEHDGRGRDLREVLAHIAEGGLGRFDLALSSAVPGSDLRAALDGIARDAPGLAVRLVPGNGLAALRAATAGGPLVYVRSSMVMQSDVLAWLGDVAEAGLLGRLAVYPPGRVRVNARTPAALAAEVASKGLPFAVSLGGGDAVRRLLGEGRGLLTLAGRMLWAFGRVPDDLGDSRLFADPLFVGDEPGGGVYFADGRSTYAFDLESVAGHGSPATAMPWELPLVASLS